MKGNIQKLFFRGMRFFENKKPNTFFRSFQFPRLEFQHTFLYPNFLNNQNRSHYSHKIKDCGLIIGLNAPLWVLLYVFKKREEDRLRKEKGWNTYFANTTGKRPRGLVRKFVAYLEENDFVILNINPPF